jgi:hypothetical protein
MQLIREPVSKHRGTPVSKGTVSVALFAADPNPTSILRQFLHILPEPFGRVFRSVPASASGGAESMIGTNTAGSRSKRDSALSARQHCNFFCSAFTRTYSRAKECRSVLVLEGVGMSTVGTSEHGRMGMHTKPQLSCVIPTGVSAPRGLRYGHYTALQCGMQGV